MALDIPWPIYIMQNCAKLFALKVLIVSHLVMSDGRRRGWWRPGSSIFVGQDRTTFLSHFNPLLSLCIFLQFGHRWFGPLPENAPTVQKISAQHVAQRRPIVFVRDSDSTPENIEQRENTPSRKVTLWNTWRYQPRRVIHVIGAASK